MTDEPGIAPISDEHELPPMAEPGSAPDVDADDMVPTLDEPDSAAHPS